MTLFRSLVRVCFAPDALLVSKTLVVYGSHAKRVRGVDDAPISKLRVYRSFLIYLVSLPLFGVPVT